jgi:hypothetical protein
VVTVLETLVRALWIAAMAVAALVEDVCSCPTVVERPLTAPESVLRDVWRVATVLAVARVPWLVLMVWRVALRDEMAADRAAICALMAVRLP